MPGERTCSWSVDKLLGGDFAPHEVVAVSDNKPQSG